MLLTTSGEPHLQNINTVKTQEEKPYLQPHKIICRRKSQKHKADFFEIFPRVNAYGGCFTRYKSNGITSELSDVMPLFCCRYSVL